MAAGRTTPRCAEHPARPAVDRCPACTRPRCGACAAASAPGSCRRCAGAPIRRAHASVGVLEGLVRAALGAMSVGLLGAVVATEYNGAGVFSIVLPALVGVGCGEVATRVAGLARIGRVGLAVRVVAALYAVIGTGYSFRFVPGGLDPFGPAGSVLPSYLAALVGTYVWTWPPRRRPAVGPRPEAVQAGEAADPLAEGSAASAPRSADSGVPRRR